MRWRPGPLKLAVIVAAVFVLGRVVYSAVFGGLGAGSPVLLELPRVRLAGPFAHVTLFGPITATAIVRTVVAALPFASLILAFGLVAALLDVRRALAQLAGWAPLRNLGRALVVAWDTVPALVDSVSRTARGARLRGRKAGPRVLVPVFERAVERAVALGTSMEVRGLGARPGARSHDASRPVLTRGLELRRGDWAVSVPDLDLRPGTLTLVSGPTGSGKSTLLHAIAGIFQHAELGEQRGGLWIGGRDRLREQPRDTAPFVALVAQRVKHAFVAELVRDEIAFALTLRAAGSGVDARVEEVARRLRIAHLLGRPTVALSAGEAELVAIAAALAAGPRVLLLDEPLAELDQEARERVMTILVELASEDGLCVVIAEHRRRWIEGLADAEVALGAPTSTRAGAEPARAGEPRTGSISLPGAPSLRVRAIVGPNGVGKSTRLLQQAAAHPRRVALVPEELEDLFLTDSVAAECRLADRRRVAPVPTLDTLSRLLGRDAAALADRHPRDCSGGELLALALALQLSRAPGELLVDEPFRGLDATATAEVSRALLEAARDGVCVTIATHEREIAAGLAASIEEMTPAGRIEVLA